MQLYKTLDTPYIKKTYQEIRKKETFHNVKLAQTRCQNLSMSKISSACNKSVVEMWGASQEVVRPTATTWFKMDNACGLCNVIEKFWQKKVTKTERGGPFGPFELQMTLTKLCKKTSACLCRCPNTSNDKGKNWSMGHRS